MKNKNWKQLIGGKPGLIIIGSLIILSLIVALDEILDLPYFLFGAPPTPINWTEIAFDLVALFSISLISIALIRKVEAKRRKSEQTLRESEERYRTLIENQGEGFAVVDQEERFTFANPAAEKLFDVPPEGLFGKSLKEFTTPEYFKVIQEQTAERRRGEKTTYEIEIINANEERRFILITATPQFDKKGVFSGTFGIFRDITERKRAEEQLRLFSHSVNSSIDGIAMGNPEGRITYVNETFVRMFGYSREELIRKEIAFIYPEDQIPKLKEALKSTMEGGWVGELVGKRKDGELFPMAVSASRVVDDEGNVIAQMASHSDITERRKLQHQLIQAEKLAAVGTLAYGIAHEFNNILAGMMANAELGLITKDSQQIKECFETIMENSHRASSITNNLLVFARQKKAKDELIDITEPLRSVLSITHRELEKLNIEIVEKFKPIPKIYCDAGQLSEVFLNIVINARDAMRPKGGTLTIQVKQNGDNLKIIFEDIGCGIPEEIKGRIFEPFVTTKGALEGSEIPGTGLGLFLSYGIIDGYKGKIQVESKVGKGSKFTILIPVSKNLPRKPILDTEIGSSKEIEKKLKILLVDDEKAISFSLKKFLESRGHKVTVSLKAKEGLEHFKKDKFDLVLSDILIPDMDGIELIKKMREKDQQTKIIVITGHILKEKEEKAKEAGADDFLIKPFKNEVLTTAISKLIAKNS